MAEENTAPNTAQPTVVQPVVTPQEPTQPSTPVEPEVMKDRTRDNFEKLLESNQRLFEQNEIMRGEIQQKLGTPAPQAQPAQPTQTPKSEWDFYEVDPKTGETFINRDKLSETMKELRDRTQRAEVQVQKIVKTNEEKEIERQNKETFAAYPQLDPRSDGFDKQFSLQVEGLVYSSLIGPDRFNGRPLTFKEAADMVRGGQQPTQPAQGTPAPANAGKGDALKETAASAAMSQPQNEPTYTDDSDLIALRFATRMGNTQALAERLVHTEHILPVGAKDVDA